MTGARAVRVVRRTGVAAVGATLLVAGAALLVLPGPGVAVMLAGLAVLATEFAWAGRRLDQARAAARTAATRARRRRPATSPEAP